MYLWFIYFHYVATLIISLPFFYISGAELVDSVLDVVRREAESCDCLQGWEKQNWRFATTENNLYLESVPIWFKIKMVQNYIARGTVLFHQK